MAVLAAIGLFAWVVYVIPDGVEEDASALTRAAYDAAQLARDYPVALAAALAACFAPAMMSLASARKYLFRLALFLTLAWLGLFIVTVHPVARAAEKVRETLSIQRSFPPTLNGR